MKFWAKEKITKETKKEYRCVSLSTYATEEEIKRVAEEHKKDIEGIAFIYHDKDTNTPHTHIALVLNRHRKGGSILGWFRNCKDEKNETCNTFAFSVVTMKGLHEYFTHSDENSKQEGKHQYKEEDIKTIPGIAEPWDYQTAWEKAEEAQEAKEQKADEVEQLLDDILNGVPSRTMCRKYGRDYMKNYQAYKNFASVVVLEETGDFERALKMRDNLDNTFIQKASESAMELSLQLAWNAIVKAFDTEKTPTLSQVQKYLNVDEKGKMIKYN